MDDNTIKLLIGFAGVVGGAIAAALANMYAANRKIKEVELSYIYKLRDGYLENARKLTGEVYIPINVLLTKLSNAYDVFRTRVNFDEGSVPEGSQNVFVGQCRNYLTNIDQLFERGADAYLTTELDNRLREFNSFVRESVNLDASVVKSVFEAGTSLLPFGDLKQRFELVSGSRTAVLAPAFNIRFAGIALGYTKQVLAAPLKSREFEKRFQVELIALKSLIKEVTLGSHGPRL
jgi:hypothetical protein